MTLRERLAAIRQACPVNRLTRFVAGRASRALSALRARLGGHRPRSRDGAA